MVSGALLIFNLDLPRLRHVYHLQHLGSSWQINIVNSGTIRATADGQDAAACAGMVRAAGVQLLSGVLVHKLQSKLLLCQPAPP